jgi:hypothetical protein
MIVPACEAFADFRPRGLVVTEDSGQGIDEVSLGCTFIFSVALVLAASCSFPVHSTKVPKKYCLPVASWPPRSQLLELVAMLPASKYLERKRCHVVLAYIQRSDADECFLEQPALRSE